MRASNDASVASSKPAVSISCRSRSPNLPFASRRSRVTPGVSSTIASFLPTRRLNSVDLPTLGRPTIASLIVIWHASLAQHHELRVVGDEEYLVVGGDGRNEDSVPGSAVRDDLT